jgi:hypothetical protein
MPGECARHRATFPMGDFHLLFFASFPGARRGGPPTDILSKTVLDASEIIRALTIFALMTKSGGRAIIGPPEGDKCISICSVARKQVGSGGIQPAN